MQTIPNFVGMFPVSVNGTKHPTCGPLVTIAQHGGAMSFHHAMTPDQAMAMADALIAAAAELTAAMGNVEVAHVA